MKWSSYLTSGHQFSDKENHLVFRFRVLNYFMLIAVVFSILVGLLGDIGVMKIGTIQPIADYVFGVFNIFLIAYLRMDKKNYRIVAWMLVISTYILFNSAVLTVNTDEARIVWFYITVYISYMLLGIRAGMLFTALNIITIVLIKNLTDLNISPTAIYTTLIAMLILSLLARAHAMYIGDYEKRLREANQKLGRDIDEMDTALMTERQSNIVKTMFLANMSHEIRTPMNGVLSMAQVLQETDLDEHQHAYLRAIQRSGKSLLSLIDDLLDLSRIEAGAFELKRHSFETWEWIEDMLNQVEPLFEERDVHFVTDISDDLPPWLRGDEVRLKQVIVNLVSNAAKFTHDGEVRLLIHGKERDQKYRLHVEVIDNGVGIAEDKLDMIFENFHQLSPDRIANKGVGLGLPICKSIVQMMNGGIQVFSAEGEGSRFIVDVDLELPTTIPAQQPKPVSKAIDRQLKILLVEDDKISRLAVESMFNSLGHKVIMAENGEKAVQLLMQDDFDVVLMDIHMPVMNGLDATRHIKEHGLTRSAIIGMTASVMNMEKEKYFEVGFDALVEKPIDFNLLLNVIRSSIH